MKEIRGLNYDFDYGDDDDLLWLEFWMVVEPEIIKDVVLKAMDRYAKNK